MKLGFCSALMGISTSSRVRLFHVTRLSGWITRHSDTSSTTQPHTNGASIRGMNGVRLHSALEGYIPEMAQSKQKARESYSPTYPSSPTWGSPIYGSAPWGSTQTAPPQDDKIRGLTAKVSALEKELRETVYDKDALISVKMEELAHLQERLDGRDTLLTQREVELDDLRSRMHQDARMAFNIKQEAMDELDHKRQGDKDLQLVRKDEEIEELHRRLNEVSSDSNSRGPPLPPVEQQVGPPPSGTLAQG